MARTGPKIMVSSGEVINPSQDQVLLDSTALPIGGAWLLSLVGYCTAAFQYRVIAVNANVILAKRFPAAGDVDLLIPNHQPFSQGEIIRVLCSAAATSTLHLTGHGILLE